MNSNVTTHNDKIRDFRLRVFIRRETTDDIANFLKTVDEAIADEWRKLPKDQGKSFLFPFFDDKCLFIKFLKYLYEEHLNILSLTSKFSERDKVYNTSYTRKKPKNAEMYDNRNLLLVRLFENDEYMAKIHNYFLQTVKAAPKQLKLKPLVPLDLFSMTNKTMKLSFVQEEIALTYIKLEMPRLTFFHFYPLPFEPNSIDEFLINDFLLDDLPITWQFKFQDDCFGIEFQQEEFLTMSKPISLIIGIKYEIFDEFGIIEYTTVFVSLKQFKNSTYGIRHETEVALERLVEGLGGVWLFDLPWQYPFIYESFDSGNFLNYKDVFTFSKYDKYAEAKNLPYLSFFSDKVGTGKVWDVASQMFSDKICLALVPSAELFFALLEVFKLNNQFLKLTWRNLGMSHTSFIFHFTNLTPFAGNLRDLNAKGSLSEFPVEHNWRGISNWEKLTWNFDDVLVFKPNAFTSIQLKETMTFLTRFRILEVFKFKWNVVKNKNFKNMADEFYPNCLNRPYGKDWYAYLSMTDCIAVRIALPHVERPYNFVRVEAKKFRDITQLFWTRNAVHCPEDHAEYSNNISSLLGSQFEKLF